VEGDGMTNDEVKAERVRICDRKHPHYGESGRLTGKVISLFGNAMAEVKLDNCQHGTEGCFVSKGEISIERRRAR
jgi:hypothetical protein